MGFKIIPADEKMNRARSHGGLNFTEFIATGKKENENREYGQFSSYDSKPCYS